MVMAVKKFKEKGVKVGKRIKDELIERRIFMLRGQRVMLSPHLAELYGVQTKALIQAVKRNIERFPKDFAFLLTNKELRALRSQIVTLKNKKSGYNEEKISSRRGKHRKYPPYVFTEQGVAMLSSVLRSKKAIQVNIAIMRAFVKLRQILSTNKELVYKLKEL